jgi:phage terminase Nu1 subunit (DNA packaging protein)
MLFSIKRIKDKLSNIDDDACKNVLAAIGKLIISKIGGIPTNKESGYQGVKRHLRINRCA